MDRAVVTDMQIRSDQIRIYSNMQISIKDTVDYVIVCHAMGHTYTHTSWLAGWLAGSSNIIISYIKACAQSCEEK